MAGKGRSRNCCCSCSLEVVFAAAVTRRGSLRVSVMRRVRMGLSLLVLGRAGFLLR